MVGLAVSVVGRLVGLWGAGTVGLVFVASLAYNAVLDGDERGQTLGKRAFDIAVRDVDGSAGIGLARAVRRALLPAAVSALNGAWLGNRTFGFSIGVIGLVDGLWPLWDRCKHALHDKLARSIVIQE